MTSRADPSLPLAFIPSGIEVRLDSFGEEIDPLQREQLAAYGLAPDRPLKVLQQQPLTVILAEEVELALEHGVARFVWVTRCASRPCKPADVEVIPQRRKSR